MHTRIKLLLLGLVCFLFFIIGNASLPVTDPVEANYALTAKEMLRHGDWLSPQIYGLYWYDKPIFIYWLLYLSYSLFGITDFAARLPGAFFGAATVVLGAWYLHRQSGRWRPALLLAALLSTSLECWFISHSIITDQPLFFFMCGTLLCAYIALTEDRKGYMTGAYVLAAGAVLTKGPVGLVLPGIFLLVFCLCQRNRVYLRRLFTWQGILLFLLLGGAWYVPMYLVHGQDFINGFLLFNNVTRATVSEHPEYNVWYYYFLLVPLSLLPWSGPCFYGWWRERGRRDDWIYATVWIVGTVLFYTAMATKYPTYSYLADMPLLLFGARALDRLMDRGREKAWFCLTVPTAVFWLALAIAAQTYHPRTFALPSLHTFTVFLVIMTVLLGIGQAKKAFPALPYLVTAGTVVMYILLIRQVCVPFYTYRSAVTLTPCVSRIQGDLYFFHTYPTSFVYYTGHPATCLIPQNTPSSPGRRAVWNKKYVYPKETESSLLARLRRKHPVSILVPASRDDVFKRSALYPQFSHAETFGNYTLYTT